MRSLLFVSTAIAAVALANPAFAQETDTTTATTDDDVGIGAIVVTAQKRAENIQDVPIAISAVSSEFLESRGITAIDDLGSIAPNVKIERAPSNKTISQIAIRGSVTINPAVTWEPAVGLYLDGVYIAKAQGSIFDVADLERVEVLRGPQGTLYGRNALAGAVNLVPRKPSGELRLVAEATYGNYDYWKGRAVVDLPAMGPLALKFSGQIQKRDGFIDLVPNPYPQQAFLAGPVLYDDTNDLDGRSFVAQARLQPEGSVLTVDYMFDYSKFDQRPDFAQLVRINRNGDPRDIFDPNSPGYAFGGAFFPIGLFENPDRQETGSVDGVLYERSRTYGHALTLTADLDAVTLKSISAYRNLRWSDLIDLDGSPLPVAATGRETRFHSYSQELQATGSAIDDRLNYVVGLFYYKEKAETDGPQSFFGGGSAFQSDYGSHTEAYAAYAQADFKITEQLKLTLGGRFTHEKKDIRRFLQILADPSLPAAILPLTAIDIPYGGVPDAKYNNFSPAATLSYEATPDVNLYARFARGFKSGGFNGETNTIAAPTADCPSGALELCDPYDAEKVDSYEVGVKTRLFDRKLIFNVAGFWDEHKDIQLSIFTAAGAASSIVRNAAAARIRGLEFEAIFRPSDAITINGSLAYLDADYKRFVEFGTDVSDNRAFPHTPKYTAALGADWRIVEGNWGKLNLVGDLNHVSKYYTFPYALVTPTPSDQNANNTRSDGRTIVNASLRLSEVPVGGGQAEVSLWARNITKEDSPSNFIDFGPGFGGLTVGYFPDPRTYGLTVGFRY
ncbi:TonB-dependent receptor [Altererythrobacter aerius]|uniref:TonB-dependent receptor n=1 Tax=Tsuneonella aeria TaxID=1837929 RepID=A0A6I4TDT8_9SPHN|nr:TonB-dependent receptor [Tsuneonella aeria]MXO74335.1 TonB-dependent receptor [Tsuneonella aeria]